MKLLTVNMLFGLCFFFGTAQMRNNNSDFKNAGDQEDYWAKILFEGKYLKQPFEKYKGQIVKANNHTFTYGDKTLLVGTDSAGIQAIFEAGIFYPGIIFGDGPAEHKTAEELSTMSDEQKAFYSFIRSDTVAISGVKELGFLRTPTSRRFRLLVWHMGVANPMLSFMELTNDKARKGMRTDLFLKGAMLTFFKEYSIII
jgi:hypothetical protein